MIAKPDIVSVQLLGGFSVRQSDRTVVALPPQAVSLLSYMLLNRSRPQTRDLLAGRFWSDLPEDRARKRLSNCLWQIRSGLADAGLDDLLVATSTSVQPRTDIKFEVDVEVLEQRLDELEPQLSDRQTASLAGERLVQVVAEYSGDLLPGHYQDWIEPERDRIRDRYNSAVLKLVALSKARSDYEVALRYARILASNEPLDEQAHQEVMRIQALLGQASAAERQFEVCRSTLETELGVEPSAATVALIERIRSDGPTKPPASLAVPSSDQVRLIGRARELSVLVGRVEELVGGQGGVVLVEGAPGIGKTRLIDELVQASEWRGARVIRAGHNELSRMQPYSTFPDLLNSATTGLRGEHLAEVLEPVWLRQAAKVLPRLERYLADVPSPALRPDEEPGRTSEALARVLLAQGGLGPTVVVLEDVHWCDDDTMQCLAQAARRLAASGVLLCMTYRRHEAEQEASLWSNVSVIEALPVTSRVVLGPLSQGEARQLIEGYVGPGGLPVVAVTRMVETTYGNPLYLLETARNPDAFLGNDNTGIEEIGSLVLPDAVAGSLRSRIRSLPEPARRSLEALAVLAEPIPASTVAVIAGLEKVEAMAGLARMVDQGFIVDDEGTCRFAHEQTRRVVYELIDPDERERIHGRAYEVMLEVDSFVSAQLAYHARLAGRVKDARGWFLDAAERSLEVNAYGTAAEHYGRAEESAEQIGLDLATQARDLLAYESVLDVLGRRDEQTILLKRLREVDLPNEIEFELTERELWLLMNTEQPEEAARRSEAALARADKLGLATNRLLIVLAFARRRSGDLEGVLEPARLALAAAASPAAKIAAETVLGKALIDLAKHQEGIEHLQRAIELADIGGDLRAKAEAVGYLGVGQMEIGLVADAERQLLSALDISREIGYRWGEGVNLLNLAVLATEQGKAGLAWGLFEESQNALGSLADARGEAFVKMNQAALALWILGDLEMATELATSAAVFFRSVGDEGSECWANCLLAGVDVRRGKKQLVGRRLEDLLRRTQSAGLLSAEVQVRRTWAGLLEANGDMSGALNHLVAALALCERASLEPPMPYLAAKAGTCAWEMGDDTAATAYLDQALAYNTAGAEIAHVTAWMCARLADELGRRERAEEQYRIAYDLLVVSLTGLPPEIAANAWSKVEEHQHIVEDFERRFEIVEDVELPGLEAPVGRTLTGDDVLLVTWTVSHPSDYRSGTDVDRRRSRVMRLASEAADQGAAARVVDLANALSVSDRTIKRDIAHLRAEGLTVRTRKAAS